MSAPRQSTSPTQQRALTALASTCSRLDKSQARTDDLFAERLAKIEKCLEVGVTYREVAAAAGVTKEAITKALRKARA